MVVGFTYVQFTIIQIFIHHWDLFNIEFFSARLAARTSLKLPFGPPKSVSKSSPFFLPGIFSYFLYQDQDIQELTMFTDFKQYNKVDSVCQNLPKWLTRKILSNGLSEKIRNGTNLEVDKTDKRISRIIICPAAPGLL